MLVFGVIGCIFGLDDWLEMQALGRMQGAAYQILSQSKILVTALFMMPVKGVYQTRMQWCLLLVMVCGMVVYMSVAASDQGASQEIPVYAYLFVVGKVFLSCCGSVYADKYAKQYSSDVTVPVQLVQMLFARMIVFGVLESCTSDLWSKGFFDGWDVLTVGVLISFCVKGVFSYVILAVLDAILKNMAECVSVLMIYFYDVLSPFVEEKFDFPTFAAVMVVVLVILAYLDSKQMVEKMRSLEELVSIRGKQEIP
jgi:drug/metabolite transporter (DMT)-like permease